MAFSKLYVGNLNFRTAEETLKQLFAQHGEVASVNILQGRGFGFVEMATPEAAQEAKGKLNGTEFEGRKLIVNDARPRAERPGDRQPSRRGVRRRPPGILPVLTGESGSYERPAGSVAERSRPRS
ncbi:MAG: RNA-binding protein [Desulfobacterales bacterium]|nr:RNA-binding protein [Desulfobacterales bacterium]